MMRKKIVLALFIMSFFTACAPKLTSSSGLFWGNWILSELEGQPVQMSGTEADAYIHFDYDGMKVDGMAGCNRFNGTVAADNRKMQFGELLTTRMTCMNQAFEDKFLKVLRDVRQYKLEGENLLLLNSKGKTLAKFLHRK